MTPSVMQHAVLLGRDSWMRFNNNSYRSLPPRPSDCRMFDELELSHHSSAGVRSCATDPVALGGGFDLRYDGAVGVTLFDEPRLFAADLVRTNGTPEHQKNFGRVAVRCRGRGR